MTIKSSKGSLRLPAGDIRSVVTNLENSPIQILDIE
jgi:hypothetical protein